MTGPNIDRWQYWQTSKITKNYCHRWIHRPRFVQITKFHQNWSICRSSSKTMTWKMTGWQVSRITENYFHQWIQHLQIVHYAKFRGKWLTSFADPRFSFPVPLFKDSHFKIHDIATWLTNNCNIHIVQYLTK